MKNQRPPYAIGLLCLIPLLGGFLGLFLIVYGLVKYKDKWLVLIGFFGVIYTVSIYSSLYCYLNYSPEVQKGLNNVSARQLNQLIQNIEFFEQKNGHYPHSLEDLNQSNADILFYDPFLAGDKRDNKSSNFNYKRYDDKFTISVGIDRKPYTRDDIFPDVVNEGNYKYGFVFPDSTKK